MARPPQQDLGKRMMNQALAVLVMVGVIAYFIYSGNVEVDEPITLDVVTTQIDGNAPGQPIKLDVALKLANNSKEGMALTVKTQCEVFNWFLTGKDREFVQSQKDDPVCPKETVSTWLETKHTMKENFVLDLDPRRVKPGDYLLFIRYWGQEVTMPVTIK